MKLCPSRRRGRTAAGQRAARDQPPRDTEEGEVAQSKRRRGRDAVDDDLDEVVDDPIDDDEDVAADEDDEDEPTGRRRGGTAIKVKKAGSDTTDRLAKIRSEERLGIFGRLVRFVREVVAELRKVIWPTRKELVTYATVVVIFVSVIVTIVALLDTAFAWAVLHVFGGGSSSNTGK
jgi:preprotein translocase subunit SecE